MHTTCGLFVAYAFAKVTVQVPVLPGVPVPVDMTMVKLLSVPAIVGAVGDVPVPVHATVGAVPDVKRWPSESTVKTTIGAVAPFGVAVT